MFNEYDSFLNIYTERLDVKKNLNMFSIMTRFFMLVP